MKCLLCDINPAMREAWEKELERRPRLAARKLNLPPRVLLGVEDSPSGVQSAHAAGMTVAMVPDQDQPSVEIAALCALVAPSLAGIAPFVKESLRRP